MKNLRSRILIAIAWVVALCVIGFLLLSYTSAVSDRLYDEAKRNFSEVYEQVDANFLTFMEDTWKNLGDWGPYIRELDDASAIEYIKDRREVWGFSRFIFLDKSGMAITSKGEKIDLENIVGASGLFENEGQMMAELGLDGASPETIFAASTMPGTYRGFRYDAVAVTYTNEALANTIKTDAFSGQSIGFVVYPDGTIALSTQEGGNVFSNYLTYLDAASNMDEQQIDDLRRAWDEGRKGVVVCDLSDTDYYISYRPLGYKDYVLLGVVPTDAVSGSLRNVQKITVDVLVKIFLILGVLLVMQVYLAQRRRLKKSRAEIEYRDVLFDLLSANLNDIFVVIDSRTFKVGYITPNVERLLGVSPDEVKKDIQLLRNGIADKNAAVNVDLLRSIALGERHELLQEWVNQQDGTHRWFREAIYHLNIQGEEKFIFILSDRTEDRIMAQGLEDALVAAKDANMAKSRFLSSMSHDIRTPMNAIMGFNTLLEANAEDPDRVREYVRKISSSSRHLLNLINDVLDMSKIESGKTELSIVEFRLSDLLEEVGTIMAPQAAAKDQAFEVSMDGHPDEYLMGDKLRVNQILINLLSNAVKYTPDGGHIEFVAKALPSKNPRYTNIRFVVKDDGMGMSEDYLKVIFDPFTREETAKNTGIQGTGLGMAITKNLVDLMGGTIKVESELDKGSVFEVDLAFAASSHENEDRGLGKGADDGNDAEASADALRGLSILAAEDNDLSAEMLVDLLEMEGASIKRASNGQEAIDMFEGSAPGEYDLILMDVQMPIMGGYEATRAIRSGTHPEAQTIPIFAMTANVFEEDVQNALDAGMTAHVPKPIDMNELRRATDRALNRKESANDEEAN